MLAMPLSIGAQRLTTVRTIHRQNPLRSGPTSLPFITKPASKRATTVTVEARAQPPSIPDRVVGALPYLLPLFDGLRYGQFLFLQYPALGRVFVPLQPLLNLYFSVPFASLVVFFAVYLGIINNQSLSRFVRFNAMQAVLLDIILIFPGLLESVLRLRPTGGFGLQVYMMGYNTIFVFLFACVVLGIGSCMAGTSARLPFVADAADAQVP